MNHARNQIDSLHEKSKTHAMAKKFKQRAISNILHKKERGKPEVETGALLPNGMPRKWRSCGYEGCDYRTQYKANLNRHQNHYGHRDIKTNTCLEIKKKVQKLATCNDPPLITSSPKLMDFKKKCVKGSNVLDNPIENRRLVSC